jgi:peptide/nickel transport system permease protein
LPLALISARYSDHLVDHAIRIGGMVGFAMPPFWVGLLLMLFFGLYLRWLPVSGLGNDFADRVRHLLLPSATIALFLAPILVQSLRSAMLEVMTADYIEVARAKGLTPRRILLKHVLRNALIPVITIPGGQHRLVAERSCYRRIRLLVSGAGVAPRSRGQLSRLSGDSGSLDRIRRPRRYRQFNG